MKKMTRRDFTAAGILTALGVGLSGAKGCSYDPSLNEEADVYGPPPDETDYDPSRNEVECVYGPPPDETDYNPSLNELEDVYGPPEDPGVDAAPHD